MVNRPNIGLFENDLSDVWVKCEGILSNKLDVM